VQSGAAGGEGGKKEDKDSTDNRARTLYDLFAVCNHFGRMGFGHYTAYARDWMDMYTGGEGDAQAAAAARLGAKSERPPDQHTLLTPFFLHC
jgi:hypothetical protein